MSRHARNCALVIMTMSLVSCTPHGEGKKAEAGKAWGNELVRRLEVFKQKRGSYPQSLSQVDGGSTPDGSSRANGNLGFLYASEGGTYLLTFKYFGPGSNRCYHDSSDPVGSWKCSGAW